MNEPRADALLKVRNLNLEYRTPRGRVKALRNIDLEVGPGRVVGVVGESGCGKSTLAAAVMGLLPDNAVVTADAMRLGKHDLVGPHARELRGTQMSMIFQDPMTALNPVYPIGSMMMDIQYRTRISRAEKRRRAVSMLKKVGIPDPETRMNAFPHQFSGGMRQRVCIAMALLVKPELLIADEPTTALDATLEVQIIQLLKTLQADIGCAILFVSHHLGVIAELCDDIVVMYAGEVVETGTVRDIFHNARHPYTQALLECDPARISGRAQQLPTIAGRLPDLVEPPRGCIFRSRCPKAMKICETVHPPLTTIAGTHRAATHLINMDEDHGVAASRRKP